MYSFASHMHLGAFLVKLISIYANKRLQSVDWGVVWNFWHEQDEMSSFDMNVKALFQNYHCIKNRMFNLLLTCSDLHTCHMCTASLQTTTNYFSLMKLS